MVIDVGYRLSKQDAKSDFYGLDHACVIAKITDSPTPLRELVTRRDEICETMRTAFGETILHWKFLNLNNESESACDDHTHTLRETCLKMFDCR